MTLTPEQVEDIKNQLREQVQGLPEDKKQQALAQIEAMTPEEIESLLRQQQAKTANAGPQKSIFRMIVDNDIEAIRIDENKEALAVLDINPISKAHIIVIPKHVVAKTSAIPAQAFSLAKALGKKIVNKLKARTTEIHTETKFGEAIVHVLPVYDVPVTLESPRQKADKEELESIAKQLRPVKRIPIIRIKKPKKTTTLQLTRRIP
ncbi:HIT family protein [Candidatus Pacearchaeota archaeon]|nr:HIT family protein [Candidatus Pacearchaeota archaeon]